MEEMTYKKGNMSIGYDKEYSGQSCLFVFEAKGDKMYVLEKLENKSADFIANSIYELQQERDTYKKQLDEIKEYVKGYYRTTWWNELACGEEILQIIENEDDK